ncbi:MAG: tetratricopeptide repeat protein [Gammaproteobacteria bacterium]|nr:tetratricopeptide repeat protein [Gammaproteobacteria bacterium]
MSLINKMLQDLETRKNPQADTTQKKSVYEDLKPISRVPSARAPARRLTLLLVLVAVGGGGAYAWTQWGDTLVASLFPAEPVVRPPAVAARKPAPPKAAPVPAPAPAPQTVAVRAAESNTPPPAAADKPAVSPVNVAQAQVVPPAAAEQTNLQPPPAAAPKPVVAADKSRAAAARESGYWTVAGGETLYGISLQTGVELWELSKWNALGREHVIHAGQKLRLTPPPVTAVKKAEPASVKAGTTVPVANVQTTDAQTAVPIPQKPVAKPEPAIMPSENAVMDKRMKPFSPNETAESEYRRAVDLLQKGRMADAEKNLKLALQADAAHTPSRELLAGLMLQRGHWREAGELLEQGIEAVPAHYPFAQLLARVHVEHGADQKAVSVMEGSRRAGAENPEYLAFLAALYQRVGKHAEAIKTFNEAVTLNPQESRSWLGLGISLEATQDWEAAGTAYQRAIASGTLDDKLLKYARQRLTVVNNK